MVVNSTFHEGEDKPSVLFPSDIIIIIPLEEGEGEGEGAIRPPAAAPTMASKVKAEKGLRRGGDAALSVLAVVEGEEEGHDTRSSPSTDTSGRLGHLSLRDKTHIRMHAWLLSVNTLAESSTPVAQKGNAAQATHLSTILA